MESEMAYSFLKMCIRDRLSFAQFEAEWRSVPLERMRSSCGICKGTKRLLILGKMKNCGKKYKVGLVLEGGGGKGSYQIGVWKAIRELGLEKWITAVSGTSVGALNAALFAKGNFEKAYQLWMEIDTGLILAEPDSNGEFVSLFSQRNLKVLIEQALRGNGWSRTCRKCFVTCKAVDRPSVVYYDILSLADSEYRRDILLSLIHI